MIEEALTGSQFLTKANPMKKMLLIFAPIGLLVVAYLFWCYAHTESYCFFYPTIDTQFASGYSEAAFSQITTGLTVQAVQQKLGPPLYIQQYSSGDLWFYTLDAKCTWGDWAWLCRQLEIRDGKVVR